MSNMVDYINWRGDLSFNIDVFNDIDALILSILSYMNFDNIVPSGYTDDRIELYTAFKKIKHNNIIKSWINKDNDILINCLSKSIRFKNVFATCFVNSIEENMQEQFSATTFLLDDNSIFIAFRGTDSSLVGWKEDFNMAFSDFVPSQVSAVNYLETVAQIYKDKPIRIGGHSKGGNLAVYSCIYASKDVQSRIVGVNNFDGPGFNKDIVEMNIYVSMLPFIKTIVPESSIVGMLLYHCEQFIIIKSNSTYFEQHDPFTWEVINNHFIVIDKLSDSSMLINSAFKDWIDTTTTNQREKIVNGLYSVLTATKAKNLNDLLDIKNAATMLVAGYNLDDETKNLLIDTFKLITKSKKMSFTNLLNGFTE